MKAPDRVTTIAIATIATVLLGTVAFALAGPPASGPADSELPVIGTTVLPHAEEAGAANASPLPHAEDVPDAADGEHIEDIEGVDADDHHETVTPEIRVEDPDDDGDDAGSTDGDADHDSSDEDHDGESSEQPKADEPH